MKFRNCFIDDKGNIFKDKTLMQSAEELPTVEFKLTNNLLEEVLLWKLVNFRDYLVHFQRVINADLSVPIIIRSDGVIMDGRHRIIKAFNEGVKTLPAKCFIKDPEPDFTT